MMKITSQAAFWRKLMHPTCFHLMMLCSSIHPSILHFCLFVFLFSFLPEQGQRDCWSLSQLAVETQTLKGCQSIAKPHTHTNTHFALPLKSLSLLSLSQYLGSGRKLESPKKTYVHMQCIKTHRIKISDNISARIFLEASGSNKFSINVYLQKRLVLTGYCIPYEFYANLSVLNTFEASPRLQEIQERFKRFICHCQ